MFNSIGNDHPGSAFEDNSPATNQPSKTQYILQPMIVPEDKEGHNISNTLLSPTTMPVRTRSGFDKSKLFSTTSKQQSRSLARPVLHHKPDTLEALERGLYIVFRYIFTATVAVFMSALALYIQFSNRILCGIKRTRRRRRRRTFPRVERASGEIDPFFTRALQ